MIDKTTGVDIKKNDNKIRDKAIKKCGIIGIVLNLLLFIVKVIVGILINSVAVISDGFNNLADSMSSVVTLIGNHLSGKPADKEHPFGHGRFEYVSSLVVAFLILITGLTLLRESFSKIIKPEELNFSIITISILALSIFVKVFIYRYNKKLGDKVKSIVLIGVAKDALNDIISTIGIIISILIYNYFDINLDGYIGVIVSGIILKAGYDIAMESINIILGEAPNEELEKNIERILKNGKYVKGFHSLKLHEYGRGNIYGSVHLEFPCNLIFKEVHDVADKLENKIKDECGVILDIHMDPIECSGSENNEDEDIKN